MLTRPDLKPNEKLLLDTMLRILETAKNNNETLHFYDTESIILSAIRLNPDDKRFRTYLTEDEIKALRKADFQSSDYWVFQSWLLGSLDTLLVFTTLKLSEIYVFFDSRDTETQKTLPDKISTSMDLIREQSAKLLTPEMPLEEAFNYMENLFHFYPNAEFLNTTTFVNELKQELVNIKLKNLTDLANESMKSTPLSMIAGFNSWLQCKFSNVTAACVLEKPDLQAGEFLTPEDTAQREMKDYIENTKAATLNDTLSRIHAFETAISCYLINHAQEICQSFWKTAETMALNATTAVQNATNNLLTAATTANVTEVMQQTVRAESNSSNSTALIALGALGLFGAGVYIATLFRSKNQQEFSQVDSEESMLPHKHRPPALTSLISVARDDAVTDSDNDSPRFSP